MCGSASLGFLCKHRKDTAVMEHGMGVQSGAAERLLCAECPTAHCNISIRDRRSTERIAVCWKGSSGSCTAVTQYRKSLTQGFPSRACFGQSLLGVMKWVTLSCFANVFASWISLEKGEGCVSQRCIGILSLEEGLALCSQLTQSNRKCNDAMGNGVEAQSLSQRIRGCSQAVLLPFVGKDVVSVARWSCFWSTMRTSSSTERRAVLGSRLVLSEMCFCLQPGSWLGWIIICSLEWKKGTGYPPEAALCGSWVCHSDSSACSTALTREGSIDTWRNRSGDCCDWWCDFAHLVPTVLELNM